MRRRLTLIGAMALFAAAPCCADTIQVSPSVGQYGTPVVSSCGTSPSLATGSNDQRGVVTVGTGAITSCIITFTIPKGSTPYCEIAPANATAVGLGYCTVSTTAITITGVSLTGAAFTYVVIQ